MSGMSCIFMASDERYTERVPIGSDRETNKLFIFVKLRRSTLILTFLKARGINDEIMNSGNTLEENKEQITREIKETRLRLLLQ